MVTIEEKFAYLKTAWQPLRDITTMSLQTGMRPEEAFRLEVRHDAAIRRAGIKEHFRLYDLRHTYATRAAQAGVDVPTLASLLGHTAVQMTMRYVHPTDQHKREAAEKLEAYNRESASNLAANAVTGYLQKSLQ